MQCLCTSARARVLLSYGNATQPDSPHCGDQLELFSRKELRDAWFDLAEVGKHAARTEVLEGDGFRVKE
ncbi:penicillin acylase family protein [Lewinella sp. IMCC34191]|uniref:penicillin acylase family protein n=1 Tax=Lewinella sp. IMCC34191 TaxID=2259172 RepID=UPI0018E566A8|nr:penicillin acylase family protein [Lewinella sp. IMCC34191]